MATNEARALIFRLLLGRMVKLLHAYMPALPPPLPLEMTSGRFEMLKLELDDPGYIESRRRAAEVMRSALDRVVRD